MTDKELLEALGGRIREARRNAGMTQEKLAERAWTTGPSVSQYENGNTEPGACALIRLARALGVPMSWLLGEEAKP